MTDMKPVLTFTQYTIGPDIVRASEPGSDGFSAVNLTALSEVDRDALEKMDGGYTLDTASLIVPLLREGLTPYDIVKRLRGRVSDSTVYRYCKALPYQKKQGKKVLQRKH